MESLAELLKEHENAPDSTTALAWWLAALDFLVVGSERIRPFPYRKWHLRNRIEDWQADEFKAAASNHKYLVFLFFFLCAATHAINSILPKFQNVPTIVVLRFVTKVCGTIVSNVVLYKIRVVLRGKPSLEKTVKTTAD